jgi:lipopolysaccharide/colanic/teichoic acid biosynthesis glycosyltransferase
MGKRVFDLLLGLLLLLMFAPILAVLALCVRVLLGSPVVFRQFRPGLQGRPFKLLKFRTMTDCRDDRGQLLPDSLRLTRFGRWLRRSSLDELPELINVVTGDMSLVGPRPLLMEYLQLYSAEQARRHEVRPGLTGWAQINGRNGISWEAKFQLDVWYVENRSMLLDLDILLRTLRKVLVGEGITQPGSDTAERFRGSAR